MEIFGLKGKTAVVTGAARGIAVRKTSLDISVAEWERVIAVNLTGLFLCSRIAARAMKQNGKDGLPRGGAIVNLASVMGFSGGIFPNPAYQASKAGMTMVMKELARTLAPDGIRVNAIAPGAIPGGGFVADNLGALVAQIPIGRPGTPDDIAQVAVAVLSERFGRYVVGTTVEVDGGIGLISWIPAKA